MEIMRVKRVGASVKEVQLSSGSVNEHGNNIEN